MKSHLRDTNESYFQHMFCASKYGIRMIIAGLACIVHAIFPDLFVTTASDTMKEIIADVAKRKKEV